MERNTIITGILLAAIVALAAGFRLYDIQAFPGGISVEEAASGEDALLAMEGDIRPFYPRNNGQEGLFPILQAVSLNIFGIGPWQLQVVSAVIGIATVLVLYAATRVWFGRLAGLLAALFLATSHWHVVMSRTGLRAILIPLFIALFTALAGYVVHAVKKKQIAISYVYAVLAGGVFAAGFYSYIAYRAMIGPVLGVVVLLLIAAMHPEIGFPHVRRYGKQTLAAVIMGALVLMPLAWHFTQNPHDFIGRAGEISVFQEDLQRRHGGGSLAGTVAYSTRETLLSFFVFGQGDTDWRHNVAGFPLLNPLVGILFLLGLAWTIHGTVTVFQHIAKGREIHAGMVYPYILLLLLAMLLPAVMSAEAMPHGLRSIGVIVPVFMLAGTAGAVGLHWLSARAKTDMVRSLGYGAVVGTIILGALYDGSLYFLIARNDSGAAHAYRTDLTEVSEYIRRYEPVMHAGHERPHLVIHEAELPVIRFLTGGAAEEDRPYSVVAPENSHMLMLEAEEIVIFTALTMEDADRFAQTQREAVELLESRKNRFGEETMRVYSSIAEEEEHEEE